MSKCLAEKCLFTKTTSPYRYLNTPISLHIYNLIAMALAYKRKICATLLLPLFLKVWRLVFSYTRQCKTYLTNYVSKKNKYTTRMIEVFTHQESTQLRLTPNRSASWKQTKLLMIGFALVVVSIATAWSLAGAWVILPFAGAEVFALVMVMYVVSRATYQWELITLTAKGIMITNSKGVRLSLDRTHAYLFYLEDTTNTDLPRFIIATPHAKFEVGNFLNMADKQQLLNHLDDAGLIICKNKWW